MKKEEIMYVVLGVLILLTLMAFAYFLSVQPQFAPLGFIPPIPQNCSDTEIKQVWDYTFIESSDNISIFTYATNATTCKTYYATKIVDETFYTLDEFEFFGTRIISATSGNATNKYLDELKNITSIDNITSISITFPLNESLNESFIERQLLTTSEADSEFNSKFGISTTNWTKQEIFGLTSYRFSKNETISNETANTTSFLEGLVDGNFSIQFLTYTEFTITFNTSCTSNYTKISEPCESDETYLTWYNDTNLCNNPIPSEYENKTFDCDFDDNGIIGDEDDVVDDNLNVEVFIDSDPINFTKNFTDTETIEIKDGSIIRVSFDYDFDNPLDLRNITIEKQASSSNFGYLIVNGLENLDKTLRVDKLNSTSSEICIRNRQVVNIDDFSSDCDSSAETKLSCPGNTSQFTCNITNNNFVVTGLTDSAVMELRLAPDTSSSSNSPSSPSSTTPPQDTTTPSTPTNPTCVPNWDCTPWTPVECPRNEEQTQVCTDLNNCGVNTGKPAESQSCVYESNLPWTITVAVLSIFILVIIIIIFYLVLNKTSNKRKDFLPTTQYTYNRRTPTRPLPQNPMYINKTRARPTQRR